MAQSESPTATSEPTVITVQGPGVKIQKEISSDQLMRVLAAILGEHVGPASQRPHQQMGPSNTDLSLTEFFRASEPKRNPDKIVTIAFYMQSKMGKEAFTVDELKPQFRSVGEPAPANFGRDFKWSMKNGWISEIQGQPGQYYVTRSGREAVEARFSDEINKQTSVSKLVRRRRKAADDSQLTK